MTQIQVELTSECSEGICQLPLCSRIPVAVLTVRQNGPGKERFTAINSCLCPVGSVDGASITTVEGIGNSKAGYHAVQGMLEVCVGPVYTGGTFSISSIWLRIDVTSNIAAAEHVTEICSWPASQLDLASVWSSFKGAFWGDACTSGSGRCIWYWMQYDAMQRHTAATMHCNVERARQDLSHPHMQPSRSATCKARRPQ